MKIAVINNFDSFVFNLVRYLQEEGAEVIVQRNDQVDFEVIHACDGILLSPGPGIPCEAGFLPEIIRQFIEQKPILGVCLGHQAIAEYFGANLELAKTPHHGRVSKIRQERPSALFNDLPKHFNVGRYHSWVVSHSLPDELIETAQFEGEIMAFEHVNLPVFGLQFHPESILTPGGRQIIKNYLEKVKSLTSKSI